jgi:hypothetical protein
MSITDRITERKWVKKETAPALKPCPCCGSTRVRRVEMINTVRIECSYCGLTTPGVTLVTVATGIWNKRVK